MLKFFVKERLQAIDIAGVFRWGWAGGSIIYITFPKMIPIRKKKIIHFRAFIFFF
jgi:hypothetical protein